MSRVPLPLLRAQREEIDKKLAEWQRSQSAVDKEEFFYALCGPVWMDLAEKSNHYHPFRPVRKINAEAVVAARFSHYPYAMLIASANAYMERVAIALRFGARMDDIVAALMRHYNMPMDIVTKTRGDPEVVLRVPLEKLLFG